MDSLGIIGIVIGLGAVLFGQYLEGGHVKRWLMVLRCALDQGNHIMVSGLRETRSGATGQKRVPMDL